MTCVEMATCLPASAMSLSNALLSNSLNTNLVCLLKSNALNEGKRALTSLETLCCSRTRTTLRGKGTATALATLSDSSFGPFWAFFSYPFRPILSCTSPGFRNRLSARLRSEWKMSLTSALSSSLIAGRHFPIFASLPCR